MPAPRLDYARRRVSAFPQRALDLLQLPVVEFAAATQKISLSER